MTKYPYIKKEPFTERYPHIYRVFIEDLKGEPYQVYDNVIEEKAIKCVEALNKYNITKKIDALGLAAITRLKFANLGVEFWHLIHN